MKPKKKKNAIVMKMLFRLIKRIWSVSRTVVDMNTVVTANLSNKKKPKYTLVV